MDRPIPSATERMNRWRNRKVKPELLDLEWFPVETALRKVRVTASAAAEVTLKMNGPGHSGKGEREGGREGEVPGHMAGVPSNTSHLTHAVRLSHNSASVLTLPPLPPLPPPPPPPVPPGAAAAATATATAECRRVPPSAAECH